MNEFLLILFFVCSHLNSAHGTETTKDPQNYDILPLIFIKHKDTLLYPNRIRINSFRTQPRNGFQAMAKFATDKHQKQMLFCPADSDEEWAKIENANSLIRKSALAELFFKEYIISENCLLKKHFNDEDILTCSKEASPTIYKVMIGKPGEQRQQLCGPNREGKMYMFGYSVCPPGSLVRESPLNVFFMLVPSMRKLLQAMPVIETKQEMYKICYDHEKHRTIYTEHNLRSLDLLFHNSLDLERKQSYPMSTNSLYFGEDIDKLAAFFNKPKKLVSPDDMAFALWRKTTFHFINVKLMNEKLIPLWDTIEVIIRTKLKKSIKDQHDYSYDVYTGAFTISNEIETVEGKDEDEIQIPSIWVKVIHLHRTSRSHKSPGIAILLRNDPDYELDEFRKLCQEDYCSSYKKRDDIRKKFPRQLPNLRCCEINFQILNFFGIMLWDNVLLRMPELVSNE